MSAREIEAEAESLDQAKSLLAAQVPEGLLLLSEEVVCDGKPVTVKATAETTEQAYRKAESQLPAGWPVTNRKELRPPGVRTLVEEAESEPGAKEKAAARAGKDCEVVNVKVTVLGKKGFLGLGKTPNRYEVQVRDTAEVEVTAQGKAKVKGRVGDEVSGWTDLLSILRQQQQDPTAATSLFSRYPHQILFAGLVLGKAGPSYFEGVPFTPITDDVIAKAKRYIDSPPVPAMVRIAGSKLERDRYSATASGQVSRKSDAMIDVCIVQVASCLHHHGTINALDFERVCRFGFEAIQHYAGLPLARYFFSLPYLQTVIETKKLSPTDALISSYMGVEGLLLEIYEDLGQGETIRDATVVTKIRSLWR